MKVRVYNSILVPWESWCYLEEMSYFQRCGKHHTEKHWERFKRAFDQFAFYDGMKQIRWTRWSCQDMKKFLDEAGLPLKQWESEERISV